MEDGFSSDKKYTVKYTVGEGTTYSNMKYIGSQPVTVTYHTFEDEIGGALQVPQDEIDDGTFVVSSQAGGKRRHKKTAKRRRR